MSDFNPHNLTAEQYDDCSRKFNRLNELIREAKRKLRDSQALDYVQMRKRIEEIMIMRSKAAKLNQLQRLKRSIQ